MPLFINETRLDSCGVAKSCRDGAPGDASMMVYGGTPPEMDICQESQGSIWVAFVIIVGVTPDAGGAGRQSEDPAAKIFQCVPVSICGRKGPHETMKTVGSTPPEFPKESTRARSSRDPV
jgi:hypothetical protein